MKPYLMKHAEQLQHKSLTKTNAQITQIHRYVDQISTKTNQFAEDDITDILT